MPDYDALLDDEVKAYIARCEGLYPPDAVDLDIAGQRRVYDAMCADFDQGRPEGVTTSDRLFVDVPCRVYESGESAASVVYYHGGGFVVGGLDSHDSVCAEICAATGLRVVAVDYPLAPEHPYPEDLNAAWAAYLAVRATFGPDIVLAGDSAGGNLAAGVSHKARAEGALPLGQVLIYPGLGGDTSSGSYVEYADAPQLSAKDVAFYASVRPGGDAPVGDPYYAPLHDTEFAGLPPTVCISAQCDPLTSDSEAYVARILAADGAAAWVDEVGQVHGYLRARSMSTKAARSFTRICDSIAGLAERRWPVV